MDSKRKILVAVGLTLFFLLIGTAGYVEIEGFSLLDAFYMTVITISTVGYGEINQLSGIGRVFTILLILSGVGSVAFAAHSFTESLIERASNPNSRRRTMKKKIDRLKNHTIICGHGRVGAAAADHFHKKGADFVVIEASAEQSKILEEKGYHVLCGDATSESVLLESGIKRANAFLALLDSDPENLFTVLTARELNPTLHIIARTEVASSESRILRAGADAVISPYATAGKRVADKILDASVGMVSRLNGYLDQYDFNDLMVIDEQSELAGVTVASANNRFQIKTLGVRRAGKDYLLPDNDFILKMNDELLVAGRPQTEYITGDELTEKIVLIDDNPVIRTLYTRLFQKAGYAIMTAENGEKGFELILKEHPSIAIVDYMLPDINGLEVCRRVRANNEASAIKLILFTTDDQDKTRESALEIGVEKVVIKSPDASEIISEIKEILQ